MKMYTWLTYKDIPSVFIKQNLHLTYTERIYIDIVNMVSLISINIMGLKTVILYN